MLTRFTSSAFLTLLAATCCLLSTGCGTQSSYPNQINAADGASYDSLTLAHGALTSLRAQVAVNYPDYAPVFNQTAASYAAAFNAYSLFRANPQDATTITVAIANLTIGIVALENSFQAGMHVSPAQVAAIRKKAETIRARAAGVKVTVSDILTELEIAAAIARTVPASQPYAALAAIIIAATSQALAAETTAAGQPIDLTTIQPVALIP